MIMKKINRNIQATTMYDPDALAFLDRKRDVKVEHKNSRSAMVNHLIKRAMQDHKLLDEAIVETP